MKKIIKPALINKDFKIPNYPKISVDSKSQLILKDSSQNLYFNIVAILFILVVIISLIYRNKYKKNKNIELKEFIQKVYDHQYKDI